MVYDNDDFTELVVLKWFKAVGEPVGKGEPLAIVGGPLGHMAVYSPAAGILDQIAVDPGVNVMEGRDIGVIK
jgi:pyruvate/2-oxoglutarate dehydrogenase complex dihydrolipoamide acyltransferase (E2) component